MNPKGYRFAYRTKQRSGMILSTRIKLIESFIYQQFQTLYDICVRKI